MKQKRIFAELLDIGFLYYIAYVMNHLKSSFANDKYFMILLIAIVIIYMLVKDFTLINSSIGKGFFHLAIYDIESNECGNFKKILLKNLIDLCTLPISIVLIFISDKTLGEIALKLRTEAYNESIHKLKKRDSYASIVIYLTSFLLIIGAILYIYLSNPINYYSVRVIFTLIVSFIILIYLVLSRTKKKEFFVKIYTLTVYSYFVFIFSGLYYGLLELIPYEEEFAKFKSAEESLLYSNPGSTIIDTDINDSYSFILFNYEGENKIYYYLNDDGSWTYYSPVGGWIYYSPDGNDSWINGNNKRPTYNTLVELTEYELLYSELPDYDKIMIAVVVPNNIGDVEVVDSLNSKFKVIPKSNDTYYTKVISSNEFLDYYVEINGERFNY